MKRKIAIILALLTLLLTVFSGMASADEEFSTDTALTAEEITEVSQPIQETTEPTQTEGITLSDEPVILVPMQPEEVIISESEQPEETTEEQPVTPTEDAEETLEPTDEEPADAADGEAESEKETNPEEEAETEDDEEVGEPETLIFTDIIFSEDFVSAEAVSTVLEGDCSVEEGVVFTVVGKVSVTGTVNVKGSINVSEQGELTVEKGGSVVIDGEESELVNYGAVRVYGSFVLGENVIFADSNMPLLVLGEGSVAGTEHYIGEVVSEEFVELTAEEFIALVTGEGFAEKDYVLTEDAVIPQNTVLVIGSGSLRTAENVTLTNNGMLLVNGNGKVQIDGAFFNNFFIMVQDSGALNVNGGFAAAETSAVVWDQSAGHAAVSGISASYIDCSVQANTVAEFHQMLRNEGYLTLTIYVADESFVAGAVIPEGIVVAVH